MKNLRLILLVTIFSIISVANVFAGNIISAITDKNIFAKNITATLTNDNG